MWVDIAVNTALSLEGLLKPIIDGLGPILRVDAPSGSEFTPNDERLEWLRIHRHTYASTLPDGARRRTTRHRSDS